MEIKMPVNVQEDKLRRSFEEIKRVYELEKELARKLKTATQEERLHGNLYTSAYDEFFKEFFKEAPPDLAQALKGNPKVAAAVLVKWMPVVEHFLKPDSIFLEVGPGDCRLSFEVAKRAKKVYAVDVSNEVTKNSTLPDNFELIISDGCSIGVEENTVDIAYSHQLMEHLHPDDAFEQLKNIYKALAPGGIYICVTPNRLSGPHDTSKFFDEIATGWHLKEYTVTELYDLFRAVGFSKVAYYKIQKDSNVSLPLNPLTVTFLRLIEAVLSGLPFSLRFKLANMLLFRGITIVGTK
jgi:SAM-dependent methyltransferase